MFCEFFPHLNILICALEITNSTKIFLSQKLLNLKISKILNCKTEGPLLVLKLSFEGQKLVESSSNPSLDCKCTQSLTKYSSSPQKLTLPSDFWFEMTDCWACHREDYTTLKGQDSGLISPKKDVLMDGVGHYLVHPEDVDLEKIEIRLTGREVSLLEDSIARKSTLMAYLNFYGTTAIVQKLLP
jgi:HECT-like Ubiquitin-conjugating enzyme (E2)-binding